MDWKLYNNLIRFPGLPPDQLPTVGGWSDTVLAQLRSHQIQADYIISKVDAHITLFDRLETACARLPELLAYEVLTPAAEAVTEAAA